MYNIQRRGRNYTNFLIIPISLITSGTSRGVHHWHDLPLRALMLWFANDSPRPALAEAGAVYWNKSGQWWVTWACTKKSGQVKLFLFQSMSSIHCLELSYK